MTVVADAGMMSEANLADVEDTGWSFVIAGKLPERALCDRPSGDGSTP